MTHYDVAMWGLVGVVWAIVVSGSVLAALGVWHVYLQVRHEHRKRSGVLDAYRALGGSEGEQRPIVRGGRVV